MRPSVLLQKSSRIDVGATQQVAVVFDVPADATGLVLSLSAWSLTVYLGR